MNVVQRINVLAGCVVVAFLALTWAGCLMVQSLHNCQENEITQLGGAVADLRSQFTKDRDLRYEVLVDLGNASGSDDERKFNEMLIRKLFPDKFADSK